MRLNKILRKAALAFALIGIAFAVAQEFIPSLKPPYNPDNFCSAVTSSSTVDDVRHMLKATGYRVTQEADGITVVVRSGCICSIQTENERVKSAKQLCNT